MNGVAIDLALVSHTNSGKTTLARTLLGRDVGEVRDAPHVTELAEPHLLLESPAGDTLRLWDTPGFGDSARLVQRLRLADNPLGWLLREVWDRHADRPFWCSQQAVRVARASCDVMLYLGNAAEDPRDAGYLPAEIQVLRWIDKPVLVLLNQIGPPRPRAQDDAELQLWRAHFAAHGLVCDVLMLDAFARCWVQEGTLLAAVAAHLPADKHAGCERLLAQWRQRGFERFDRCVEILASELAGAAHDREAVDEPDSGTSRVLVRLGLRKDEDARGRAMAALAARLDAAVNSATDRIIAANGLEGTASETILQRVQQAYATQEPIAEGRAALFGGVLTGALTGLKADLASGGLSFGAGMVLGALVGGLGGAGIARGLNRLSGNEQVVLRWPDEFLDGLMRASMLRYLAVAHYGRGRGRYVEGETPPHWQEAVQAALAPHIAVLHGLWAAARDGAAEPSTVRAVHAELHARLLEVLRVLYPGALDDPAAPQASPQAPGAPGKLAAEPQESPP